MHTYHVVMHVPVVIAIKARRKADAQKAALSRAAQQKPVYDCMPVMLKIIDVGEEEVVERPHLIAPSKSIILPGE